MTELPQGTIAEAHALTYLMEHGYHVFIQFDGHAPFDYVAYRDGELSRVEVKSTSSETNSGSYAVDLRRTRPNKTEGNRYEFNPDAADILLIYVVPENRIVEMDHNSIQNKHAIWV